jgi:hypothetical protein
MFVSTNIYKKLNLLPVLLLFWVVWPNPYDDIFKPLWHMLLPRSALLPMDRGNTLRITERNHHSACSGAKRDPHTNHLPCQELGICALVTAPVREVIHDITHYLRLYILKSDVLTPAECARQLCGEECPTDKGMYRKYDLAFRRRSIPVHTSQSSSW